MKTKTGLVYVASKRRGVDYIDVKIRLDDECGNKHCDFSITADGRKKEGTQLVEIGGCCHEEILKWFPEFVDFVKLHLSDCHGAPMYALENGLFILKEKGPKACADYLRISLDEAKMIQNTDELYAAYLLVKNGIVERWKAEADDAISHLEWLTGETFVNPYTVDERPNFHGLSPEDEQLVERRISEGYYTPEAIQDRKEKAEAEAREKERRELEERFDKDIAKAEREKAMMLFIFDRLGSVDNVIFYQHRDTVVFNYSEPQFSLYKRHWTKAEFDAFVEAAYNDPDFPERPEKIQFEMAYEYE